MVPFNSKGAGPIEIEVREGKTYVKGGNRAIVDKDEAQRLIGVPHKEALGIMLQAGRLERAGYTPIKDGDNRVKAWLYVDTVLACKDTYHKHGSTGAVHSYEIKLTPERLERLIDVVFVSTTWAGDKLSTQDKEDMAGLSKALTESIDLTQRGSKQRKAARQRKAKANTAGGQTGIDHSKEA